MSTLTNSSMCPNNFTSVVSVCREMGARPSHRPRWDWCWDPAEPGDPTGAVLEVSHDRAPSNLHQVQPVPLTQCAAWGLRTQKHTAHTHSGNGGSCRSMLFTQMGLFCHMPLINLFFLLNFSLLSQVHILSCLKYCEYHARFHSLL